MLKSAKQIKLKIEYLKLKPITTFLKINNNFLIVLNL